MLTLSQINHRREHREYAQRLDLERVVRERTAQGLGIDHATPDRIASGREQLALALDAIDRLPDRQREAILAAADGHTERMIATGIGISQPTAHRLLVAARARLAIELD
jgi:DNA-directed RNA polymerase specialized sigma24 family protein